MRTTNRDVPRLARHTPDYPIEGRGAVSYTERGYWSGYLPPRLKSIFSDLISRQRFIPTVYSYGTPIAWYDRQHNVWVVPAVSYSVTTAKHQGSLYQLGDYVSIPADCGLDEYQRYVSQKMTYSRWGGIKPGPRFTLD